MAHVRKEIRRVLNDMGFDNGFLICDKSLDTYYSGGTLIVTITGWRPHPDALNLKRRLKCCASGGIEVCFQMEGRDRVSAA